MPPPAIMAVGGGDAPPRTPVARAAARARQASNSSTVRCMPDGLVVVGGEMKGNCIPRVDTGGDIGLEPRALTSETLGPIFNMPNICHERARRPTSAVAMLVLISAAPSLFARAPFTARRVFVGSGPATGRSKVLAGLQPRSRPVAMADSFVDDEVEMMGQKVGIGHTLRAHCRHTACTRRTHGAHTAHTHTRHTLHTHGITRWSHAALSRRRWA